MAMAQDECDCMRTSSRERTCQRCLQGFILKGAGMAPLSCSSTIRLHIAGGRLPPQNGFGLGGAFVFGLRYEECGSVGTWIVGSTNGIVARRWLHEAAATLAKPVHRIKL